jgi:hypothetical protein
MCLVSKAAEPLVRYRFDSLVKRHMSDYFVIRADWADVSLERETENVPHDGRFHILIGGRIVRSVRSQKVALRAYKEAIRATGKEPPSKENAETASAPQVLQAEETQRQFHLSAMYWAVSHDYSRPEKLRK